MMSKISALYDDEDALSNVQKAAQRAQMRKRAQASAVAGTDCEGILHKLPMKKHGILGQGKDRVFKLSGCVLKYYTVRSHKLKGVVTLMPNAELEENINSAGDLMGFSLVVPETSGKLVAQRSVFTYDDMVSAGSSFGGGATARPKSPRMFQPGFIDPLSKFVQCLRNSIAQLRKKPEMEGVMRKLPMSGKTTQSGEQARYFTLQTDVLRYFGGGSLGGHRHQFNALKGNIKLTKDCQLRAMHAGLGFMLDVPGQGKLVATADNTQTGVLWFNAINAALMRLGGGVRPSENSPPMSRVQLVTSMSELGLHSHENATAAPPVPAKVASSTTLGSRGSSLYNAAISGDGDAASEPAAATAAPPAPGATGGDGRPITVKAVPVVVVHGTPSRSPSSATMVTTTATVRSSSSSSGGCLAPQPTATVAVASAAAAGGGGVLSFLQRLGLERFAAAFDDEGYDTLKLVAQMRDEDFAEVGMKRGHIRILMRGLSEAGLRST